MKTLLWNSLAIGILAGIWQPACASHDDGDPKAGKVGKTEQASSTCPNSPVFCGWENNCFIMGSVSVDQNGNPILQNGKPVINCDCVANCVEPPPPPCTDCACNSDYCGS